MKDKIINAIGKGLSKSLEFNIDNNEDCFSIKKSNKQKTYNYDQYWLDEFDDLIEKCQYDKAWDIYKETGIGADKYISFIDSENKEISFKDAVEKDNLKFVKISNKELKESGNEIYISIKQKYVSVFKWEDTKKDRYIDDFKLNKSVESLEEENVYEVINDYNGFYNSKQVIKTISSVQYFFSTIYAPAIKYCNGISMKVNGCKYQGYLGALGQYYILVKYIDIVNLMICNMKTTYSLIEKSTYWTSTEHDISCAWMVTKLAYSQSESVLIDHKYLRTLKILALNSMPFFKPNKK